MDRYVDEDYKTAISHVGIPTAYGIISPSEIWEPEKGTKWILQVTRARRYYYYSVWGK